MGYAGGACCEPWRAHCQFAFQGETRPSLKFNGLAETEMLCVTKTISGRNGDGVRRGGRATLWLQSAERRERSAHPCLTTDASSPRCKPGNCGHTAIMFEFAADRRSIGPSFRKRRVKESLRRLSFREPLRNARPFRLQRFSAHKEREMSARHERRFDLACADKLGRGERLRRRSDRVLFAREHE